MAAEISIIVPFYNEEENVLSVLKELLEHRPGDEIIAVDDGSDDKTWEHIKDFKDVKGIRLEKHCGQSAAIYKGLTEAKGEICVLMDGDGQSDPASIEFIVAHLKQRSIVCGYRKTRQDKWNRRMESRIANSVRNFFLRDGIRDICCSQKAFYKTSIEHLVPFNGMHRFLPLFFKKAGYTLIEVPVNHRPRMHGKSKYKNFERGLRGLYDIFGVRWVLLRTIHFPKIEKTYE